MINHVIRVDAFSNVKSQYSRITFFNLVVIYKYVCVCVCVCVCVFVCVITFERLNNKAMEVCYVM